MAAETQNNKERIVSHRQMIVWQNADRLDVLAQQILKRIPKHEFKLREQIDTASDSIGANFVEGFYSGAISEYIRFVKYSKRSLGELQERVRRVLRKGYIMQREFDEFDDLAAKTMYLFDRLLVSLQRRQQEDLKKQKNRGDKKA